MNIIENYKNIKYAYLIDSWKPWKNLILLWATHWDEPSGYYSNLELLESFQQGKIILETWKLIIVTKNNYQAFQENVRYIDIDLNRVMTRESILKQWFEYQRATEIMQLLDESDYLLDLHSTSGKSEPFLFSEKYCLEIAKSLWVSDIVVGWADIWEKSILTDNEWYMHANGKTWFTLEAWSHDNAQWKQVCYQASLNFLSYFGNIDKRYFQETKKLFMVELYDAYIAQTNQIQYCIDEVENFTQFRENQIILQDWDFELIAWQKWVMVMPWLESKIQKWEEVFFFWKEIKK